MTDDLADFLFERYSVDIFTPLTDHQRGVILNALHTCGVTNASERLRAQWARHLAVAYEHYRDEL